MPDRIGGADRASGIAGSSLQIAFCEASSVLDLTIGDRIVSTAAGKRDCAMAIASLQRVQ